MDQYPHSDEEFELTYGDELELIREQEELLVPSEIYTNNVALANCIKPPGKASTPLNVNGVVSVDQQPSSTVQVNLNQNETPVQTAFNKSTVSVTSGTKKRSIAELFGDIDDILSEEIVEGMVKKRKSSVSNDDYALIEHILELRKVAKERCGPVGLLRTDHIISNKNRERYNISYTVPKYSFIVVTRNDGERIYVRCHSEDYEKEEVCKIAEQKVFSGMMGETFKEIQKEAEEILSKQLDREGMVESLSLETNSGQIKNSVATNIHLWVDLYKPDKYLELLSDESTNRTLLKWLKLWDKVVFKKEPKSKIKNDRNAPNNKFQKQELFLKLDQHGYPEHKVVLLCGPPGLGKTTLAHMVAKHAGYDVIEINASDERSVEKFQKILKNSTQMHSLPTEKKCLPNCLVFDEIDGAPAASIEYLIKFIHGTTTSKKKKTVNSKNDKLKRPIICICNDVYVPALRPLRQIAFVVNFPPTASQRLAERLQEIARHEGIKADLGALLALCEKSGNDIRSCLTVLHFFKSLNKAITLTGVYKTDVGQKDMQKGLFAVWQDIFQIKRPKHKFTPSEIDRVHNEQNINMNCLRYRMKDVLQVVRSFGDYEKLAQGIFENFPDMKVRDTTLMGTCEALEWFCFTDVLNAQIYGLQNYSLLSYLPYAFVVWNYVFASVGWQKLTFPSAGYEAKQGALKNVALLGEVMKGMKPIVRAFTCSDSLRSDTLPILSQIILPVFRPVNLHLYTAQEREQLNQVVSIMIDYNLNYVQERMPEGNYVFNIDPNIEEITTFSGFKPKRVLSYSNKQLVAREIEVEKIRRVEIHKVGENSSQPAITKNVEKKKQVPNHLQRLKTNTAKPKVATVVKDFFGRIVEPKATTTAKIGRTLENDIWYQFKEGYNNAVRKTIKISSLS